MAAHQVFALPCGKQEDAEADGQDKTVQAADEDQHGGGRRRDEQVADERDSDEDDRRHVAGAFRHVLLEHGQERDGGIRRADDACDGRSPEDDAE
ncbi:hypothetical protein D3C71_1701080 [compost metagenome]